MYYEKRMKERIMLKKRETENKKGSEKKVNKETENDKDTKVKLTKK